MTLYFWCFMTSFHDDSPANPALRVFEALGCDAKILRTSKCRGCREKMLRCLTCWFIAPSSMDLK